LIVSALPGVNSIGGAPPGKYRPGIGGHSAPDSTATALSRRSVQQVLAARAAASGLVRAGPAVTGAERRAL